MKHVKNYNRLETDILIQEIKDMSEEEFETILNENVSNKDIFQKIFEKIGYLDDKIEKIDDNLRNHVKSNTEVFDKLIEILKNVQLDVKNIKNVLKKNDIK